MIDMGGLSLAVDPVPDQVAQHHPFDLLRIEIICRHHMAPFLKAHDLFGLGVNGIASAVMFDIADDAGLDLVCVTMAGIAVTDVLDGKHLVDAVQCELQAEGKQ